MSLFPAPRWVINLGLVTAAAVLPMLAASFVLTLVQVGLLPEPDNGVMWKAVQIVLLSMGPGLVLFATRRRDKAVIDSLTMANFPGFLKQKEGNLFQATDGMH